MTRYRCIKSSVDLHLLDRARNHDKVYHLAVFERDDGSFDVLYRYGRRGKTLRLGILKGGENVRDYRSASNLMTRKEAEQVNGDGYQYASGITPGVWNDLLPPPLPSADLSGILSYHNQNLRPSRPRHHQSAVTGRKPGSGNPSQPHQGRPTPSWRIVSFWRAYL